MKYICKYIFHVFSAGRFDLFQKNIVINYITVDLQMQNIFSWKFKKKKRTTCQQTYLLAVNESGDVCQHRLLLGLGLEFESHLRRTERNCTDNVSH